MIFVRRQALLFVFLAGGLPAAPDPPAGLLLGPVQEGTEMLGQPAPGLDPVQWLDAKSHPLEEGRDRPVLVRWWTAGCGYCVNSSAALEVLHEETDQLRRRQPALCHEEMRELTRQIRLLLQPMETPPNADLDHSR